MWSAHINKIFGNDKSFEMETIMRAIDKITKKPKEQILKEYQEIGFPKDKLEKIRSISQWIFKHDPKCVDMREHIL